MFIKSFKTKSNVQLKSSDRKKLQAKVFEKYSLTDEQLLLLFPAKSTISHIKIITHSEQIVTVYACDKKPLFFECPETGFLPTVYTVWTVPTIVSFFTTHPAVLPRLANGADLMLPGIFLLLFIYKLTTIFILITFGLFIGVIKFGQGINSYGYHKKDEIVAVNLSSNKAAVAIGRLARSSEDLYMSAGQGICVKIFHVFGDKLWAMESSVCSQIPFHGTGIGLAPTENDFPALGSEFSHKKKPETSMKEIVEKTNNVTISKPIENNDFPALGFNPKRNIPTNEVTSNSNICHEPEEISKDNAIDNANNDNSELPQISTKLADGLKECPESTIISEDDILKNAFFTALKRDGKNLQLPLLTSNFYRCFMLPLAERPIDLKKTSYKKLSKFLNEMCVNRFITVKEEQKGIEKIFAINNEHPDLLEFIPKILPRDNAAATTTTGTITNDDKPASLFVSEMTELYLVTDETAPLFAHFSIGNGDGIEVANVKKLLKEYVCQNKLQSPLNSRMINLNPLLGKICDVPAVDEKKSTASISFDELLSIVMLKMIHSYEMRNKNEIKTAGGKKATIQMTLATRSGNKKVTLVNGLESFGIRISEFDKACRVGVAASTAITKVAHQKGEQFMVQGNQIRFIHKLLTNTYKIPSKNIIGLELAKKEKKVKK